MIAKLEGKKRSVYSSNKLPQTKLIILCSKMKSKGPTTTARSSNYSNNNTGVLTERLLCARHCAKDSRRLLYLNLVIIVSPQSMLVIALPYLLSCQEEESTTRAPDVIQHPSERGRDRAPRNTAVCYFQSSLRISLDSLSMKSWYKGKDAQLDFFFFKL